MDAPPAIMRTFFRPFPLAPPMNVRPLPAILLALAAAPALVSATARADDGTIKTPGGAAGETWEGWNHQRSWELPAVDVEGEKPALRDDERVGSYLQPRWTTRRSFTTTRAYVIPEGKVEAEVWARSTFDGGTTKNRFLQEIEIGLPHRFQLDLYLRQDSVNTDDDKTETNLAAQFEVRYALADWGKLWGNPTLYLEYIAKQNDPDVIEPKFLLSGNLCEGWHWASNFTLEAELSGEAKEHEWGWTGGISRTIVDSRFALGAETVVHAVDEKGSRGHFTWEWFIGPSLQYRPIPPMTLNITPLIGIGRDSPDGQLYFNLGYEF